MRLADLEARVGGLSYPTKMPCPSYGLPARACAVGSRLALVPGSVCSACYARKGQYVFPCVQQAQYRRLAILTADLDAWKDDMIALLSRKNRGKLEYFRWHDSGDIQSAEHLVAIVAIAKALPRIHFWLPTKEKGIVSRYLSEHRRFPANLTVRLSAAMVDTSPPKLPGIQGSAVYTQARPKGSRACLAPTQNGECRECRACWDRRIPVIAYHKH
jgi:hypothetical protein